MIPISTNIIMQGTSVCQINELLSHGQYDMLMADDCEQ